MRRWMSVSLMVMIVTSAAFAQDARLRRLQTSEQGRAWDAVGRLDIAGNGFCTGALIAPNLVLTAAHCLFDSDNNARIDPARIEFLAGWRNGRASAYRDVARAVIHPDYVHSGDLSTQRVRNDLALLELDRPIQNTTITPFSTAARPRTGDRVGVVSYAQDRAEAPSLQDTCKVLSRQDGVLVTSCSVDFGSSGAPIFTVVRGEPQIVSVVSAKAQVDGMQVAMGTALGSPLERLRAEMVAGKISFGRRAPLGVRVRVGDDPNTTGAKFVKP